MRSHRRLLGLVTIVIAAGWGSAFGAPPEGVTPALSSTSGTLSDGDKVLRGDAKCTSCHGSSDAGGKTLSIGMTKHGTTADARTPGCTDCHGASIAHSSFKGDGTQARPDIIFGPGSPLEARALNRTCLGCHQKDARRMHWSGSPHDVNDVSCASCHEVHSGHDDVLDKHTQAEVCYGCHKDQRALANKPSHHPIPEGKMTCSDCHNPHGSFGEKLLVKDTVNTTCYVCHAEKRGPFIWGHQPVTEDCDLCHNPHGTTADTMLKVRAPFLCLSCHDPASHLGNIPSVASAVNTSKNAAGKTLSSTTPRDNKNATNGPGTIQGLSCMNCHTDIHGSNNPVGNSPTGSVFWR
jgi:DmsE family decaheme c-type cytochrome